MRPMPSRFADTTALFEACAGTGSTRREARSALSPKHEVASSEHVQREWKRVTFHGARDFLEAVEHEPDLAAVLRRMGIGYGREPSQRWLVAALLVASSDTLDIADIKIRARRMLRGESKRLLRQRLGELRSSSSCGLAVQEPTLGPDGTWVMKTTCQRGEGICQHEDRLGHDLARWRAGAIALRDSEKADHRKMGTRGVEMADDPPKRTGVNCFGRTGDLAIALDCRSEERLVTTDASFAVMAEAMGFSVHRLEASARPKGAGP